MGFNQADADMHDYIKNVRDWALPENQQYQVERFSFPDKDNIKREPIDYIYGVDPATGHSGAAFKITLRTDKDLKWQKSNTLYGPNGVVYRIKKIGAFTWLNRILSRTKYYNARLTVIEEQPKTK